MNTNKQVVFTIGTERYGLPISRVERILAAPPLTRVPRAPREVRGVFDLRGDVLAVVDTRVLLGLNDGEPGCLLVLEAGGRRVAISADRVESIVEYAEKDVEEVRADGDRSVTVGRHGENLTLLLDPDSLLSEGLGKKLDRVVAKAA